MADGHVAAQGATADVFRDELPSGVCGCRMSLDVVPDDATFFLPPPLIP